MGRKTGITKLWCWALVLPLFEGVEFSHPLPPWSLDLADAIFSVTLQHRVPAAAWESSGTCHGTALTLHTPLLISKDVLALSCAHFWVRVKVSLIS